MTSRVPTGLLKCLTLPIKWLSNTEPLLTKTAAYKAIYPLSIADAWIAACASEQSAVLLPLKAKKMQTR